MAFRPNTMREYDLFFFDCETGGLHPFQADIIEVACIRTDPTGLNILEEYHTKVLPVRPVQERSAQINGYTREKWAAEGAIDLGVAMVKMLQMARNALFTAHNAPFDWGFFEYAMQQRYMRWASDYHKNCTMALSMPLLRNGLVPNVKLATMASYFNVDPGKAHEALSDAHTCRGVFIKLMEIYDAALAPLVLAQPKTE